MSRAFVREPDADPGPLPDRPISPHPNFVTRRGLAAIEPKAADRVRFSMRVTLRLPSRSTPVFRLVGEDEADATHGRISWTAPLAQALLGREVGESVPFQGAEAEIVSIEP